MATKIFEGVAGTRWRTKSPVNNETALHNFQATYTYLSTISQKPVISYYYEISPTIFGVFGVRRRILIICGGQIISNKNQFGVFGFCR